ncbi:MAG: hypothetical protein AB7U85_06455 [Alphaproteobacteria bacterium]
MNKSLVLFMSLAVLTLTGCASKKEPAPEAFVQLVLANSSGVSYEYNHLVSLQTISEKATSHCSSEGKKPILQGTSILQNGNQVASFVCQ